MTKTEVLKRTLNHETIPEVPYAINLAPEGYQVYGKRLLEQYATGKRRVNWDGHSVLFFVAMVAVGVLLAKNLITGGGVHLVYERPKAAVTVEGTLDTVNPLSAWSGIRYMAYGESSSGYEYTIGDLTLTGMAKGTLEPGDDVTVTYLPKSGFVLSIEEQ